MHGKKTVEDAKSPRYSITLRRKFGRAINPCLDNSTGPSSIATNTAGAAFAVTLSVPRLNRSSRMSTSSLLLAWLAWLAFICTSLADADVVAGTTSKCVSESLNGHDYSRISCSNTDVESAGR